MLKLKIILIWLFTFLLIAGCHFRGSGIYRDGFPGTASWRVLPFANFSQAEGVSPRVERMVVVLLPSLGVENPSIYQGVMPVSFSENAEDEDDIVAWNESYSLGFAVGGEIRDWFIDESGYAHVTLTLQITEVGGGKILWSNSGSGEGMAGESIYDVCRALLPKILESLPVLRRQ